MPWDMNLSFAGYGTTGPRDEQVDLSIDHPWAGKIKLFDRLMSIEANQKAYRAHLRRFVEEFFNPRTMHALMDTMQAALAKADNAAAAAGLPVPAAEDTPNGGGFGNTRFSIRQYITGRTRSVLDQLDGKSVHTFQPQPTPHNLGFNWGLSAGPEFGNLPQLAQAIRRAADADGDYRLTPREARDGVAALYYETVDEQNAESLQPRDLREGLTPLLRNLGQDNGRGRGGFFGMIGGGGGNGSAGGAWTTAIFNAADEDHDVKLTLPELTTAVDRLFCLADRDQNGYLDDREIIEALDLVAAPQAAATPPDPNAPIRRLRK
jgi:hypothetical protein